MGAVEWSAIEKVDKVIYISGRVGNFEFDIDVEENQVCILYKEKEAVFGGKGVCFDTAEFTDLSSVINELLQIPRGLATVKSIREKYTSPNKFLTGEKKENET